MSNVTPQQVQAAVRTVGASAFARKCASVGISFSSDDELLMAYDTALTAVNNGFQGRGVKRASVSELQFGNSELETAGLCVIAAANGLAI